LSGSHSAMREITTAWLLLLAAAALALAISLLAERL
jgi:hypothetical protein